MHLLYHLVCLSQATAPLTTTELTSLLDECRQCYVAHHVTGLLLYRPDGGVLQVLEGEERVLRRLYQDRLAPDLRHLNCVIVEEGPWVRRSFPNWYMSFVPDVAPFAAGFVPLSSLPKLLPQWAPTRPTLVHRFLDFAAPYYEAGAERP